MTANPNRLLALASALAFSPAASAQPPAGCPAISGDWSGISACVDRRAAPNCVEERVRFHFRVPAPGSDRIHLNAEKWSVGGYVAMGDSEIACDRRSGGWSASLSTAQFQGRWSYRLDGAALSAELRILPAGAVIRRVALHRG